MLTLQGSRQVLEGRRQVQQSRRQVLRVVGRFCRCVLPPGRTELVRIDRVGAVGALCVGICSQLCEAWQL